MLRFFETKGINNQHVASSTNVGYCLCLYHSKTSPYIVSQLQEKIKSNSLLFVIAIYKQGKEDDSKACRCCCILRFHCISCGSEFSLHEYDREATQTV